MGEATVPVEVPALDVRARLELLETVCCGIWVYDGSDVIYVNHALEEITGFDREQLLAPAFFEQLILPEDRDMIVARGQARIRGEDVIDRYDVRIIDSSAKVRTLTIQASSMLLEGSTVSVVSATDSTPLREAEESIRDGTKQVIAFLNAVPVHLIATDVAGKPTFVNTHWLEFTNQPFEEAMARGTAPLIHPDDVKRAARAWAAARKREEPYEIEYRVRDAAGDYRWQLFRIRPVRSDAGVLTGWTSASVDVHETRQLRQELQETVSELGQAIAAKDEVLGLISHELRTPLTTLMGNASYLLRRGEDLDAAARAAIAADLTADSRRLYAVIENMLVLSRIGAGSIEIEREPARLNRLAEEVIEEFRVRSPGRPVQLSSPELVPLANVNPGYYKQILGNLVSNADKYSPAGLEITIEVDLGAEGLTTRVIDRGPGIPSDQIESVFAPFFRSPEHAAFQGIGLGLTVCQRLVELQDGEISVHNRAEGGCCFSFTSPLMDNLEDD